MKCLRTSSLRLVLLVVIGLLPTFGLTAGLGAQQRGASEPVVVLDKDGAEVSVIGSATIPASSTGDAYLILERISIGEGAAFGPWTPGSPELIAMEDGELVEQDERGFWSRMEAPYQMSLEAGTPVEWNALRETNLLRLRLTDAAPDDAEFDGVKVERIAQFRLDAVPDESALVFIAEASFTERGGGARIDHDGSVGIVVVSGAIDVLSPSGLEGRLGEGQSALYPDGAPIEFLGTADDEPASALLVGVSTTDRTLEAASAASKVATSVK